MSCYLVVQLSYSVEVVIMLGPLAYMGKLILLLFDFQDQETISISFLKKNKVTGILKEENSKETL